MCWLVPLCARPSRSSSRAWPYVDTAVACGAVGIESNMLLGWTHDALGRGSSVSRRITIARYTFSKDNYAMVHNFIWQVLLKDGEDVLQVIADELSFLHDYYYSSLPIYYSKRYLQICTFLVSVLSMVYCISMLTFLLSIIFYLRYFVFELVPVFLLLALANLSEMRDIASCLCSNWTKVALICYYVNHASWQQSPWMRNWVGRVLRRRCRLLKHWTDKMNQCSLLVLHPKKTPIALLRRLVPQLPEPKKQVKMSAEVKQAVVGALRNNMETLGEGIPPSLPVVRTAGDNILQAQECSGKATTFTLLVWHIATSVFEIKHPNPASDEDKKGKVAATHLSRYCAYLVAYSPELLPDDDKWSKSLYKSVKKDAESVLAGGVTVSSPEGDYQQLLDLLMRAGSKHQVLEKGARLGKQLVDEMVPWEALAGFWSEMLLYLAPSDNLEGHAEAIARGGELITLLWALLGHVGVVSRPDSDGHAGAPVAV